MQSPSSKESDAEQNVTVFLRHLFYSFENLSAQTNSFLLSPLIPYRGGSDGTVARALDSHHGDPGSIPDGFTPGSSHVGIVRDDATCRRVFLEHSHSPILAFQHRYILVISCPGMTGTYGSQLESLSLVSDVNLFKTTNYCIDMLHIPAVLETVYGISGRALLNQTGSDVIEEAVSVIASSLLCGYLVRPWWERVVWRTGSELWCRTARTSQVKCQRNRQQTIMDLSADYETLPTNNVATHMTAGAVAGVMEHCIVYPLDSVKGNWAMVVERKLLVCGRSVYLPRSLHFVNVFFPFAGQTILEEKDDSNSGRHMNGLVFIKVLSLYALHAVEIEEKFYKKRRQNGLLYSSSHVYISNMFSMWRREPIGQYLFNDGEDECRGYAAIYSRTFAIRSLSE
ncbi:hypothetical protein PR048_032148 [Dryococelus australis]|uniref:Uncharacterized protein n=1 Tax=Dryococelus australis TaxID=614101 RepID=A0ABQ9G1E7_9NEOP|nr:hypothetical protein PR048_032148 [Dryococelus australis]